MQDAPAPEGEARKTRLLGAHLPEAVGITFLIGMVAAFLALSWRKWPDPLIDFGQQCYCFWRLSLGEIPYHDFQWNYGPFSLFLNAALFKCFGPGIMVLVCANLVVYFLILAMAYAAFRVAWGWRGAFAACATFISVFSFSHLLGVGNYNYATPYAGEAVHGMALILAGVFIVNKWTEGPSLKYSFLLGLTGGLSAVIKPEFMLALGLLGMAAMAFRYAIRERPAVAELVAIIAGLFLPTLFFTILLSRAVPFAQAFEDASQAWWLVLIDHAQSLNNQQQAFSGLSHPAANLLHEAVWTGSVLLIAGAVVFAGRVLNSSWPLWKRLAVMLIIAATAWELRMREGWFFVGRCLPGLMFFAILAVAFKFWVIAKHTGKKPDQSTRMKAILILLAGAMLARMAFSARVYHLGFFQAALAGMVAAAVLVEVLPRWSGAGRNGKVLANIGCWGLLVFGCGSIAAMSLNIRAAQTQEVGQGRDRFYCTKREMDGTGAVVAWTVEKVSSLPESARVLVLPEGTMINYLARRKSFDPAWERGRTEAQFIERLAKTPPDYVIFITRDTEDFGIRRFGAEGNTGRDIVKWVAQHYVVEVGAGGDPLAPNDHPGALIMRLKGMN